MKIIFDLITHYYTLDDGVHIEDHLLLEHICTITSANEHPHRDYAVYITRKALKHFVESRKRQLLPLETILFMASRIHETIQEYDTYTHEPPEKHFYHKGYANHGVSTLRVLLGVQNENLEIISVHFQKVRKNKNRQLTLSVFDT